MDIQILKGFAKAYYKFSMEHDDDDGMTIYHLAVLQLIKEQTAKEQEIIDLKKQIENRPTYCAYCGFTVENDPDGSIISEHIHNCPKHPIAQYKKKILEYQIAISRNSNRHG